MDKQKDLTTDSGGGTEDVLENVTYARAYNAEHQEKLLVEASGVLKSRGSSLSCLGCI